MKHSALAAGLALTLFGLMTGGCTAVTAPARTAQAVAVPVHFDAPRDDSRKTPLMTHESPAAAAKGDLPAPHYPPEVVHEARIELAREALDADNQAKADAEEAEQMQRDIAAAEAADGHHPHAR